MSIVPHIDPMCELGTGPHALKIKAPVAKGGGRGKAGIRVQLTAYAPYALSATVRL